MGVDHEWRLGAYSERMNHPLAMHETPVVSSPLRMHMWCSVARDSPGEGELGGWATHRQRCVCTGISKAFAERGRECRTKSRRLFSPPN